MIQAFIFDMDGVIIDSEPMHFEVDIQVMNYYGSAITHEQLEQYVGMTNPEMWAAVKEQHNLTPSVSEIIEYQLSNKIEMLTSSEMEPIDGIRELLAELKARNIPAAIASSSPPVFIKAVLRKFDLLDHFECVVSGEEVERGKPAPDVYLKAAELLGVKPQDCMVLEDARHGVAAAKAAGMKCIGFVNPNSGNQDLSQADYVVHAVSEVAQICQFE
ncbi:HAD-superfamily hydrolase, subfamily IA, variant 3 [Paenibacillus vortex V453]|uniref:Phosphatase n=2 Tax=Paenibacillus TaxID=44249 RepID=A0A163DAU1_9BACL|nr:MULTISPECIES: HAD family phosphatase [Paenibacillus]ANA82749.1 phosphatase [Paenibacillus glucanolyticus]AVV58169.1 HAD family phosphatase [Paenibacillus glucanolyticus]EFU39652.1 HAD-superfamily hydrolase, subfamily IA, variant 3 [Paenibacillus vortex V453]ETT42924.1 HAD-superfamily hydrolase [Paenibacillus sp. FSL R5-808]KZS43105.1 phosphatase [Paenibacillus glucanolyticus]